MQGFSVKTTTYMKAEYNSESKLWEGSTGYNVLITDGDGKPKKQESLGPNVVKESSIIALYDRLSGELERLIDSSKLLDEVESNTIQDWDSSIVKTIN